MNYFTKQPSSFHRKSCDENDTQSDCFETGYIRKQNSFDGIMSNNELMRKAFHYRNKAVKHLSK